MKGSKRRKEGWGEQSAAVNSPMQGYCGCTTRCTQKRRENIF